MIVLSITKADKITQKIFDRTRLGNLALVPVEKLFCLDTWIQSPKRGIKYILRRVQRNSRDVKML